MVALAKVVGRAINADVTRELSEIKEKLVRHVTMRTAAMPTDTAPASCISTMNCCGD